MPIDLETMADSSTSRKAPSETSVAQKDSPKKQKFRFMKGTDLFWYPAQQTSPPRNYIPGKWFMLGREIRELISNVGLIPVLRKSLLKCHHRGQLRRAALCFDKAVHVHREIWDSGWGCG